MGSPFQSAQLGGAVKLVNQAQRLVDQGNNLQALALCKQLLKKYPKAAEIWGVHSAAQVGLSRYSEARRSAQKGLKLNPGSVDLRIRLGLTYVAEHRFADAAVEFERALEQQPGRQWTLRCLTDVLSRLGRDEEAYELLRPHVIGKEPDTGFALAFLKVCLKTKRYDEGLALAEPLVEAPGIPSQARTPLLFTVAELYAKAGQHDRAFEVYRLANECSGVEYDAGVHRANINRMINAWTPEAISALEQSERSSDRFVFIVGMPRSGTSLVEQIIASHRSAFGCGELGAINNIVTSICGGGGGGESQLPGDAGDRVYSHRHDLMTPEALDWAARQYGEALRKLAPGAERLTDKMPANVLHLGLIGAMAPHSRIIHCVRDSRDTCLSCYFHDFLGKGNAYTYDLADLGDYFADYWRLIKHWKSVLKIQILDVQYEELISDQERQSKRMIEFLGLEWDERCLEFHKNKRTTKTLSADQVSKPMYQSSKANWKPYEKYLEPLLERLPSDSFWDGG